MQHPLFGVRGYIWKLKGCWVGKENLFDILVPVMMRVLTDASKDLLTM